MPNLWLPRFIQLLPTLCEVPLCLSLTATSLGLGHKDNFESLRILPNSALIPRMKWALGKGEKRAARFCSQNQDLFFHAWNPFSLLIWQKNSNWVKYRKFTTSPFYLLLHLCTGFINDDSGNWLDFGALVSYLMWGSSWENIHTCHSWALFQGACYWASTNLPGERLPRELIIGPLEKMFFFIFLRSYTRELF